MFPEEWTGEPLAAVLLCFTHDGINPGASAARTWSPCWICSRACTALGFNMADSTSELCAYKAHSHQLLISLKKKKVLWPNSSPRLKLVEKGDLIYYPHNAVTTSPKNNIFDAYGESADLLQEAWDLLSDLLLQLRIPGEQRVAQQHLKEKIECENCRVERDKDDIEFISKMIFFFSCFCQLHHVRVFL